MKNKLIVSKFLRKKTSFIIFLILISALNLHPTSAEIQPSFDELEINYIEDITVLPNGSSVISLFIEIPPSKLSEIYANAFFGDSDDNNVSVNKDVYSAVFLEQFLNSLKEYHLYSLGFSIIINTFNIYANDFDGLLIHVQASSRMPIIRIFDKSSLNKWSISLGSHYNSSITASYHNVYIQFIEILLESIPDEQVFRHNWITQINLPVNSTFSNPEINGMNWNIDYGGGNYKDTIVVVEDDDIITIEECMLITEEKTTIDPDQLISLYSHYKKFEVQFTTPYHIVGIGSTIQSWLDFPMPKLTVNLPFSSSWNSTSIFPISYDSIYAEITVLSEFKVDGYVGWEVGLSGTSWFTSWVTIQPTIKVDMKLNASAYYYNNWTKPIFSRRIPFYFQVGPAPLWFDVVPSIDLIIEVEAEGSIYVNVGVTITGKYKIGSTYDKNEGWSRINPEPTYAAIFDGPYIEASASIRITPSIDFRLSILFYGVAGPYVSFEPYSDIILGFTSPPPEVNWILTVNFNISAGVTFADWIAKLGIEDYEWPALYHKEINRWEGQWTPSTDPGDDDDPGDGGGGGDPPGGEPGDGGGVLEDTLSLDISLSKTHVFENRPIRIDVLVINSTGSRINDAIVICYITCPDGTLATIPLNPTLITGKYSNHFYDTSNTGTYSVLIEGSLPNEIKGIASTIFTVDLEREPVEDVYSIDAYVYNMEHVSYPYSLGAVIFGETTYQVNVLDAYFDRIEVLKNDEHLVTDEVNSGEFEKYDDGNLLVYVREWYRISEELLFLNIWLGVPSSGPVISPDLLFTTANQSNSYSIDISSVNDGYSAIYIRGEPINWYSSNGYGASFPGVNYALGSADDPNMQLFLTSGTLWPESFSMNILPPIDVPGGTYSFDLFIMTDDDPSYDGGVSVSSESGYFVENIILHVYPPPPEVGLLFGSWNNSIPKPGDAVQGTLFIEEKTGVSSLTGVEINVLNFFNRFHVLPSTLIFYNSSLFEINGGEISQKNVTLTIPVNVVIGTYSGYVRMTSDQLGEINLPASIEVAPPSVNEVNTVCNLDVVDDTRVGISVDVVITVTDESVSTLDGCVVELFCSGGEFPNGLSNINLVLNDGTVETDWVSYYIGNHSISVIFPDQTLNDVFYGSSFDSSYVNVTTIASTTSLSLDDDVTQLFRGVNLRADVNVSHYHSYILFESSINGSTWEIIGFDLARNGVCIYPWIPQNVGDYYLRATTLGDSNVIRSISPPKSVIVEEPRGQKVWNYTYGNDSHERGEFVQQTSDGGYIIVGGTYSYGNGRADIYLVKTDAYGTMLWNETYGESFEDFGYCVRETEDGKFIIVGYHTFLVNDVDKEKNSFLLEVDSRGRNRRWVNLSLPADDYATSVIITNEGDYVISGHWEDVPAGMRLGYLAKIDVDLNIVWIRNFSHDAQFYINEVHQTPDDGFIFIGSMITVHNEWDIVLVKTNSEGIEEWREIYGGQKGDWGDSFKLTSDGGYIIASTVDKGTHKDIWVIKYDSERNHQWDRWYGGEGEEVVSSIQQTSDGGFLVCGTTSSFGAGSHDVYFLRLDTDGSLVWDKAFGGLSYEEGYHAIETPEGFIVATGLTYSYGFGYTDVYLIHFPSTKPPQTLKISTTGNGYTNPRAGSYIFNRSDVTTVHVISEPGWKFTNWILDDEYGGTDNKITISLDQDRTLRAVFTNVYTWPQFSQNYTNAGFSSSLAPNDNTTYWIADLGETICASPVVENDRVYIATATDHILFCLDVETGHQIWNSSDFGDIGDVLSSPAVIDGKIYVTSYNDNVYCFDALDGSHIWTYTTHARIEASPTVYNGKVYVGSADFNFYCLDGDNGSLIWMYSTGDEVLTTPAVSYGRVYFGSNDDHLYCFDAENGTFYWKYQADWNVVSPPLVSDGRVYVGSLSGHVYCVDAFTGSSIWTKAVDGIVLSCPSIAYNRIYVGTEGNELYCFDISTGDEFWHYKVSGDVRSSPAIADEKVYIGSNDKTIYCFDAITGGLLWDYYTRDKVSSTAAICDGTVYFGSQDNNLYSFKYSDDVLLNISIEGTGTTSPNIGENYYDYGVDVAIHAEPTENSYLSHWLLDGYDVGSENPYHVIMTDHHTLTAIFLPTGNTLYLSVSGNGTTTPEPGVHVYPSDESVEITASSQLPWFFSHWILNGNDAGSETPYTIVMNDNYDLIAVFGEYTSSDNLTLLSPQNNSIIDVDSVTLRWSYIDNDENISYNIYLGISTDPPLYVETLSESQYEITDLALDTPYYWKITAIDPLNITSQSPTWTFTYSVSETNYTPEYWVNWTKTYGFSNDDLAYDVEETSDGGYILTGLSSISGSRDMYLVKTDPYGNETWSKTYGLQGVDEKSFAVHQAIDDGYLLVGTIHSGDLGGQDLCIVKTDSSGNEMNTLYYGGSLDDSGSDIIKSIDGYFLICGTTSSFGDGGSDIFLLKTDYQGNLVWNRTLGGVGSDEGFAILQTASGECYISGISDGEILLVKTDASGNEIWSETYGYGFGRSITQTSNGSIVIVSDGKIHFIDENGLKFKEKEFGGSNQLEIWSISTTQDDGLLVSGISNANGNWDVYVHKTESYGDKEWDEYFGGTGSDYGYSGLQTKYGSYLIAGLTTSSGAGGADAYLVHFVSQNKTHEVMTYDLTISVQGYGTTSPSPDTYTHNEGSIVSVEASPEPGWYLSHWTLNDINVGSANPYKITFDQDYHIKAIIVQEPEISVSKSISTPGETIIVEGNNFTNMHGTLISFYLNETQLEPLTTTYSNGSFTKEIIIPEIPFGNYVLTAIDENGVTSSCSFKIGIIAILISPSSGTPESNISLTGIGFNPGHYNATIGEVIVILNGIIHANETLSDIFTVPNISPGNYTFYVDDKMGYQISTQFNVLPAIDDDEWVINLNLDVSGYTGVVFFGMKDDATLGFDAGLGEGVFPPAPNMGVATYFYYPDNPSSPINLRKLTTSYHDVEYPSVWNLRVETIGISGMANLSWSQSSFDNIPENYTGILETNMGSFNMREINHIVWAADSDSVYLFNISITTEPEYEYVLMLRMGWNMVSLPVVTDDMSADTILDELWFYQLVSWSGTGYTAETEFEPGRGYWLLVLEDVNITLVGAPVYNVTLVLQPGWNMIGGPDAIVQASEVFPGFYQLVTWSGTGYTPVSTFEPGKGYWALVLLETEIQLPPT